MPQEPGKPTSAAKSSPNVKALGDEDTSKKSTSEKALKECGDLEEELAALRVTYEQYFLGNERQSPVRAHEDLRKRINKLKTGLVRNTAVKFRIASLHNKFLTYERLWQRTLQEIEAGTYRRDLFKAKRRSKNAGASGERRPGAVELTEELSDDDLEEVSDIVPNEPKPLAASPRFIPQPVESEPVSVPFRPMPPVATVPAVPMVASVVPSVAPAAGTPFRGTPTVGGTPLKGTPAIPPGSTPSKGTPVVAPGGTPLKGTAAIPPGSTPTKGTAAIPPGSTPSKGTSTIAPGGTPSKGTAGVPPGGTPSRGSPGLSGPPMRGVPAFGAPSQGTSGIAAALENLADEPLSKPSAPRTGSSAPSKPGNTGSSAGSKPSVPAVARPASSASQAPKPAAVPASNLSDEKLKVVYDAYVTAKRRNQEDTSKMSYESVAANLRKQVPELLKQHNAKSVEFKVVIKDGKATLKAVPK